MSTVGSPNALYNTATKTCVLSGATACYQQGQCALITSLTQPVVNCCNCTMSTCAVPSPSPSPANPFALFGRV